MGSEIVTSMYRLDAEVEETTLFREPRALGCRCPELAQLFGVVQAHRTFSNQR